MQRMNNEEVKDFLEKSTELQENFHCKSCNRSEFCENPCDDEIMRRANAPDSDFIDAEDLHRFIESEKA